MWVRVLAVSELAVGEMTGVMVPSHGFEVLIAREADGFYAAVAKCPHGETSLAGGSYGQLTVVCPGHGYRFNLRTGACSPHRNLKLLTLPVKSEGDDVLVQLTPHLVARGR